MTVCVVVCLVCVMVNRGCDCGPVLNSRLISQLPAQFGPGSIRRVLRAAVQSCVDCSPDQSTIYNLLREGTGRVVITGQLRSVLPSHNLPTVYKAQRESACCIVMS